MAHDLPESESQTPDGVPLGWEAPWEKPQMMVVEEREGMPDADRAYSVSPAEGDTRLRSPAPSVTTMYRLHSLGAIHSLQPTTLGVVDRFSTDERVGVSQASWFILRCCNGQVPQAQTKTL